MRMADVGVLDDDLLRAREINPHDRLIGIPYGAVMDTVMTLRQSGSGHGFHRHRSWRRRDDLQPGSNFGLRLGARRRRRRR